MSQGRRVPQFRWRPRTDDIEESESSESEHESNGDRSEDDEEMQEALPSLGTKRNASEAGIVTEEGAPQSKRLKMTDVKAIAEEKRLENEGNKTETQNEKPSHAYNHEKDEKDEEDGCNEEVVELENGLGTGLGAKSLTCEVLSGEVDPNAQGEEMDEKFDAELKAAIEASKREVMVDSYEEAMKAAIAASEEEALLRENAASIDGGASRNVSPSLELLQSNSHSLSQSQSQLLLNELSSREVSPALSLVSEHSKHSQHSEHSHYSTKSFNLNPNKMNSQEELPATVLPTLASLTMEPTMLWDCEDEEDVNDGEKSEQVTRAEKADSPSLTLRVENNDTNTFNLQMETYTVSQSVLSDTLPNTLDLQVSDATQQEVGEVLKDTLPETLPQLSCQENELSQVDEAKEKELRNNSSVMSNGLQVSSISAAQFGDNAFLSPDRQRRRCSRQRSRQRSVRRELSQPKTPILLTPSTRERRRSRRGSVPREFSQKKTPMLTPSARERRATSVEAISPDREFIAFVDQMAARQKLDKEQRDKLLQELQQQQEEQDKRERQLQEKVKQLEDEIKRQQEARTKPHPVDKDLVDDDDVIFDFEKETRKARARVEREEKLAKARAEREQRQAQARAKAEAERLGYEENPIILDDEDDMENGYEQASMMIVAPLQVKMEVAMKQEHIGVKCEEEKVKSEDNNVLEVAESVDTVWDSTIAELLNINDERVVKPEMIDVNGAVIAQELSSVPPSPIMPNNIDFAGFDEEIMPRLEPDDGKEITTDEANDGNEDVNEVIAPGRKPVPIQRMRANKSAHGRRVESDALDDRRGKEEKDGDDDVDDAEDGENENVDNDENAMDVEPPEAQEEKKELTREEQDRLEEEWRQNWITSRDFRLREYNIRDGPDEPIDMGVNYDYKTHITNHLANNDFPESNNGVTNLTVWTPELKPKVEEMTQFDSITFRRNFKWKRQDIYQVLSRPLVHDRYLVCFAFLGADHQTVKLIEFDPSMTTHKKYGEDLMCFVQAGLNTGKMTVDDYLALCAKCDIYDCPDLPYTRISGVIFEPDADNGEKRAGALCWGNYQAFPVWPLEQGKPFVALLQIQTIVNMRHLQEGEADEIVVSDWNDKGTGNISRNKVWEIVQPPMRSFQDAENETLLIAELRKGYIASMMKQSVRVSELSKYVRYLETVLKSKKQQVANMVCAQWEDHVVHSIRSKIHGATQRHKATSRYKFSPELWNFIKNRFHRTTGFNERRQVTLGRGQIIIYTMTRSQFCETVQGGEETMERNKHRLGNKLIFNYSPNRVATLMVTYTVVAHDKRMHPAMQDAGIPR